MSNIETIKTVAEEKTFFGKKLTSEKVCYLFLVFLLGCFVGWIYEEVFYWITEGMLRNRGILYGPWLPIYGVGALGIYVLKPFKRNVAVLFGLCVLVTGVVEYIIGYVSIHLLGLKLWDYSGLFLNIGGIVCFRSVVSFGILGLVFHYLIEPMGEKLYAKIPAETIKKVCFVLVSAMLADCVLSFLFRSPITY